MTEATVKREVIEATIAASRDATERGDWDAFVDCFAEDGRFMNAALASPLEGREAIRGFAKNWPRVVNVEEWRVLEGDRFSIGWNERHFDAAPDDVYRGISVFRIAPDGSILDYEGFFDPAKVAANYGRAVGRASS